MGSAHHRQNIKHESENEVNETVNKNHVIHTENRTANKKKTAIRIRNNPCLLIDSVRRWPSTLALTIGI